MTIKNLSARRFLFIVFYFALSFIPLIVIPIAYEVPLDREVDVAFVNGFITATGIVLAALSAASISRSKDLDAIDYYMVRLGLLLFFAAILCILIFEIMSGKLQVWHLGLLGASLIFNTFTVWLVLDSLRRAR